MTNTTVTGNTASTTYGGGVGFNGGNGGTILNSTIAGNVANSAGGGLGVPGSSSSDVHVKNSVVAGNTAATDSNCGGPGSGTRFTSDGHNLDSGTSCGFAATGDRSADPRLGPLANNGGPTKTMALLPGSPAIDTGDNSGCPAADQRGQVRPVWGARALVCDIGAFEVAPSSEFQITANAKCKTRRCSAVLVHLRLPGPGSLTAADASAAGGGRASAKRKALIEPTSVTARGSGPLVLRLNLTATARTKLGRKNKLRISVRFLFSPRGGTPHAKTQLLKIKPRRGRHHS